MNTSPLQTSFFYFLMGALFTYLATESAHDTIWNFSTVALMVMATLDFGMALRLVRLHIQWKNKQE
ncbi:MAG: YdiK family protein [Anoxybacillus sp.]|nr:YdiK family protein [Anoxybacillus sp.]MCL6587159.1 YdiK family protein [Anoxybacillus sp.]